MHWARWGFGVAALAFAGGASAQDAGTLTLDRALELARQNNPAFLSLRNDEGVAAWAVREAYGNFLPNADVSMFAGYVEPGPIRVGNLSGEQFGVSTSPSYYFSNYRAGASMTLNGQRFFNVAQQRANRTAVAANVVAAEVALETAVTRSYLTVLRTRDLVELRRQEMQRATENLELAQARVDAGVAIPLDAKQAQVERGRAQVALLTAGSDLETGRFRLIQQLGLEIDADFTLATQFPVFEPTWSRDALVDLALRRHPSLRALRATASAQRAAARTAWSSYLPSVTASVDLSGFTQQIGSDEFLIDRGIADLEQRQEACIEQNDFNSRLANPYPMQDCTRFTLTPERQDSIQTFVFANNRAFPFDFEPDPATFSLFVSLPIFQGFTRTRQVEQAQAAAEDTEHQVRGERLRLEADIAATHNRLETAYQAVQIEETNRVLATEQLEMARERYRVGLDSFFQLTEAETLKSQADQSYLAAVYTFHEALTDLESAVGEALRTEGR